MTLPKDVQDARGELDAAHDQRFAPWRNQWQTIRAHMLSQDAEIERLKSACAIGTAQDGWRGGEEMALIPRHYASNIQVAARMMEQSSSVLDRREAPVLRKIAAMLSGAPAPPTDGEG